MAGKATKPKRPSAIATSYLRSYNLVQVFGWSYILYKLVQHDLSSMNNLALWHTVTWPVFIFQHGALLEIMHAATGLVPSNAVLTTFQVLSRVMVVSGVLLATPESYAASSSGLPLALLAWSITEIIRYLYYFFNLSGYVPYLLTWFRYTLFIILYPIGITGELLCLYAALKYASSNPEAWSFTLPNSVNFIFSYYYLIIVVMLSYIPIFPILYLHMFAQRRKILGGGGDSQKKAQ